NQKLKPLLLVVNGHAPLLVMIRSVQLIRRPRTTYLCNWLACRHRFPSEPPPQDSRSKQKRRPAPFRATRLGNFALRLSDVPFQSLGDLLFWHRSHDLLDDLSVLEQQQRRDS